MLTSVGFDVEGGKEIRGRAPGAFPLRDDRRNNAVNGFRGEIEGEASSSLIVAWVNWRSQKLGGGEEEQQLQIMISKFHAGFPTLGIFVGGAQTTCNAALPLRHRRVSSRLFLSSAASVD